MEDINYFIILVGYLLIFLKLYKSIHSKGAGDVDVENGLTQSSNTPSTLR